MTEAAQIPEDVGPAASVFLAVACGLFTESPLVKQTMMQATMLLRLDEHRWKRRSRRHHNRILCTEFFSSAMVN